VGPDQKAAVPLVGVDRGADPAVAALVHIARGTGYLGFALLVGAAGTRLLLDGTAGRSTLRKQTRSGGLTLTLSAAVSLLAQGPYAAGTGLSSLVDPDLLHATLSGRTGVAEAARVVLAAALTLPDPSRSPADQPATPGEEPDAKVRPTPEPMNALIGTVAARTSHIGVPPLSEPVLAPVLVLQG
jgi:copper transport protein